VTDVAANTTAATPQTDSTVIGGKCQPVYQSSFLYYRTRQCRSWY